MTREKAQALCRNYAEHLGWPLLQVFEWSLDDKFQWKQFINLAPLALLMVALAALRDKNEAEQLAQELAG